MANKKTQAKTKKAPQKSWVTDKNDQGKSSYDTIVDWILIDGNYDRWTGKKSAIGKAERKTQILQEIQALLMATGHGERDTAGISQQIRNVKVKFESVKAELGGTGSGVDPSEKDAPNILR